MKTTQCSVASGVRWFSSFFSFSPPSSSLPTLRARPIAAVAVFALACAGCGELETGVVTGRVVARRALLSVLIPENPPLANGDDLAGVPGVACTFEGGHRTATTDADGRFTFSGVRPGAYLLICRREVAGRRYAFLKPIEASGGLPHETYQDLGALELEFPSSLAGRAVLGDGLDPTGIRVYAPGTSHEASTDATGAYLMDDLPVGALALRFEREGYAPATVSTVVLASGARTEVPEVVLGRVVHSPEDSGWSPDAGSGSGGNGGTGGSGADVDAGSGSGEGGGSGGSGADVDAGSGSGEGGGSGGSGADVDAGSGALDAGTLPPDGGGPTGPTSVSGLLSGQTTFTLAGSPYWVTGDVLVPRGSVLTVEPGVEVRFRGGQMILMKGALIAEGTEAAPIVFTAQDNPQEIESRLLRFQEANLALSRLKYVAFRAAHYAVELYTPEPCVSSSPGLATQNTGVLVIANAEMTRAGVVAGSCTGRDGTTGGIRITGSRIDDTFVLARFGWAAPITIENSTITQSDLSNQKDHWRGLTITGCDVTRSTIAVGTGSARLRIDGRSRVTRSKVGGSLRGGALELLEVSLIDSPVEAHEARVTMVDADLSYGMAPYRNQPRVMVEVGSAEHSRIVGNGTGVGLQIESPQFTVNACQITGHGTAVWVTGNSYSLPFVLGQGNDLQGEDYALVNHASYNGTGSPVTAPSNYWGVGSAAEVAQKIIDVTDDPAVGAVDSSGFASSPVPGAGPR